MYIKNKNHSLINGFALSLAFKQRLGQLKKGLLQGDIICADEQFVCIVHDCCCSWYVTRLRWVYYLNNLLLFRDSVTKKSQCDYKQIIYFVAALIPFFISVISVTCKRDSHFNIPSKLQTGLNSF